MKPFEISPALASITGTYPEFSKVRLLFKDAVQHQNMMFVRLWLAEGIPFAFQNCPSIYQVSREWLAKRLSVDPHHISIVGSARLGYSLNPSSFERGFYEKSDLDYVVVSESLFSRCAEASIRFVADFESGEITPPNERNKVFWSQDVDYIKRNTPKGFLNQGKVPNFTRYEEIRYVEDQFWRLSMSLKRTTGLPPFTKATYRIYKDQESFVRRAALNLHHALTQPH